MKQRMVILRIDDVMALVKDYAKGEIPQDAMPVQFRLNKAEGGKLALEIESGEIPQGAKPLEVRFNLKRIFGLGGGNG